jgi:predicted dithiol-disulfide oxidoreductase (DUF899 family)
MMYLICYMRQQDRAFETYWTTIRGVEAMNYSYALLDLTAWGRQEPWEDSPTGWPLRRPHRRHGGSVVTLSTTARAAFVTRPLLR